MALTAKRRKICLTPIARVPCSNAANIGERKTWTQSEFCTWQNSVRGNSSQKCIYNDPANEIWPNTVLSLVGAVERRRCSNEAKTRNALKICWGAQNSRTDLSRYWAEVHHTVRTSGRLHAEDIAVLWSPYGIGRPYIFSSCFFFLLSSSSSFFFPRLISAVGDWMSTILRHMVWS